MKQKFNCILIAFGIFLLFAMNGNSQSLYVGVNYHPHNDKNPEKIKKDIELMKAARFTCVRLGHLAWDSYEPSEGQFDFERFEMLNEISGKSYKGKKLDFAYNGKAIQTESTRFDIVEPKGIEVIGSLTSLDKDYPIITVDKYGNGSAIYVGLPAKGEVLGGLVDELIAELGIKKGPEVPSGVMARQIDQSHFVYLNISSEPKEIPAKGNSSSIFFDKDYAGKLILAPFEPEFIEIK